MLWIQSSNPITNMGQDAPRIYRAMEKVPFICVVDLFKTPFIVACADLVLPCAMSNERDCIRVWFDPGPARSRSARASTRRRKTSRS